MSHHTEICVAFNNHFASAGFLFENPNTEPPLPTVDLISGVLPKPIFTLQLLSSDDIADSNNFANALLGVD